MRGKLGWIVVLGLVAGTWGGTGAVEAQRNQRPLYGALNLRAGFTPDPQLMRGNMGGTVDASRFNPSCSGSVHPQPSHVVRSRTGFRNIRFVVSSEADATLMVRLPNGAVLCDDDGGEGLNPLIETASPAGEIHIWVGVWSSRNEGQPYTIGITELPHITASTLQAPTNAVHARPGAGITPNAQPAFGTATLRPGFMPDPHVVAGRAGGPIAASNIDPSCRGYISAQPSHVVMTQASFPNFRVVVNAGHLDTTLVVMTANGQVFCNDDGGAGAGTNPVVQLRTSPGPLRIWVGTYSAAQSGPYNVGFTELGHITPATLPAPGVVVMPHPQVRPQVHPQVQVQPQIQQVQQQVVPVAAVVSMQVNIPVTLMGPGLESGTVALWQPRGGTPTQISLNGRALMAGPVSLAVLPPSMEEPVVTVMQQRDGTMIVRAEQVPLDARSRGGETMILRVRWEGHPVVADRWTGGFGQPGPRWAR